MGHSVDLRAIDKALFTRAKQLWAFAVLVKLGAFALGVAGTFGFDWEYVPQLLLLLAIGSEGLQIWSDYVKGQAESLLRTLDLCRSFGRRVSEADTRDIVMAAPRGLRDALRTSTSSQDTYFDSAEPAGPRRAVESLLESAWYTRHQARVMKFLYAALILSLLFISVFALVITARDVAPLKQREQIVKTVTGWLMLVVSLSMARSVLAYGRMQQRCLKTEATCHHLLMSEVSEADALKQWYEYQLSRSAAPLLPDWLWRMMSPRLDIAWHAEAK